jgi:hypothetical protein
MREANITFVLKRLAFILIGYTLASIASGIVVAGVYGGRGILTKPDIATMLTDGFGLCAAVTMFIAAYAALPALLVVLIGEFWKIQIWIYYAVSGCLIGAALPVAVGMYDLIAAGVIFGPIAGLIYWYIAGRKASLRQPTEA